MCVIRPKKKIYFLFSLVDLNTSRELSTPRSAPQDISFFISRCQQDLGLVLSGNSILTVVTSLRLLTPRFFKMLVVLDFSQI